MTFPLKPASVVPMIKTEIDNTLSALDEFNELAKASQSGFLKYMETRTATLSRGRISELKVRYETGTTSYCVPAQAGTLQQTTQIWGTPFPHPADGAYNESRVVFVGHLKNGMEIFAGTESSQTACEAIPDLLSRRSLIAGVNF